MTQTNSQSVMKPVAMPWTAEQIEIIRRTVAVDASPAELNMFLHLAAKYDLDPLAREIWFIKTGRRNVIMTSRDGYLKIAHTSPQFAVFIVMLSMKMTAFVKMMSAVFCTRTVQTAARLSELML